MSEWAVLCRSGCLSLNEGPLQKEGQSSPRRCRSRHRSRLNEGPLQKEGQYAVELPGDGPQIASMKGPSRRRGNTPSAHPRGERQSLNEGPLQKEGQLVGERWVFIDTPPGLNEGPLQKEGQFGEENAEVRVLYASMKGPSRRRGNRGRWSALIGRRCSPQ